jgi:hypothetical protein
MKKSTKVQPKKRGRPATGKDPLMGFRAPPELRAAIVKWAENHPDQPGLSASVRRLVELGLTVKPSKPKQSPAERAARAKELASRTIDTLTVGAANSDEHAIRKRRLIKGPEEFRDLRVDHTKKK